MKTIQLNRTDWGQVVDALEERKSAWSATREYLEGNEDVGVVIEECSDAEEAASIEAHYSSILIDIRKQLKGDL